MKKLNRFLIPIILIVFWIAVFIRGVTWLDPDFGWHVRFGQVILQNGVQLTDPFSYTMPSFAFIDHEWLSNVIMFLIYSNLGMVGLAIIFASIFTLSLFIASKNTFKQFSAVPLFLAGTIMFRFSGVRVQEITWLFLALLLKVILEKSLWVKYKYFVPLLFLPWVNLHGGFAIGIAVLFIVFILNSVKIKKIAVDELKIAFLSLIVTFINPYGIKIWQEVWIQITDSALHSYVLEWYPAYYNFDFAMYVLFVLASFFVYVYRKKLDFTLIGLYVFFTLIAISSVRHIPLWAIFSILIVSQALRLFWLEISKKKDNIIRLNMIKKIIAVILIGLFLIDAGTIFLLNNYNFYPKNAVNFLKQQNFKGNLFSVYDFGGYLIWNLPNKKVYIDGRMPSWRRTGIYPGESNYALKDYFKMLSDDKFFNNQIKKYKIAYLLIPKPEQKTTNRYLLSMKNFLQKFMYGSADKHILSEDLTKRGMVKIYEDKQFVIYKTGLF